MQTPVPKSKHQKRVREELPLAKEIMKEFILQKKKPKLGSNLILEGGQLEIIDLEETEVSTSTSAPMTPPSSSPTREPLEIIQHLEAISSEEHNIFSRFLYIKHNNEALKYNVYS